MPLTRQQAGRWLLVDQAAEDAQENAARARGTRSAASASWPSSCSTPGCVTGSSARLSIEDLHADHDEQLLYVMGKGQKQRWVPLNRPALTAVRLHLRSRGNPDARAPIRDTGGRTLQRAAAGVGVGRSWPRVAKRRSTSTRTTCDIRLPRGWRARRRTSRWCRRSSVTRTSTRRCATMCTRATTSWPGQPGICEADATAEKLLRPRKTTASRSSPSRRGMLADGQEQAPPVGGGDPLPVVANLQTAGIAGVVN